MGKSGYIVQKTEKSFCMECGTQLDFLCPQDIKTEEEVGSYLAFYICGNCGRVAQTGKGPVKGKVRIKKKGTGNDNR